MHAYFGSVWLPRLIFQRGLAAIYLIAFATALQQFPVLLGEHGFLPVERALRGQRFWDSPSLFHWRYSDGLLRGVAWSGMVLAALALSGVAETGPVWLPVTLWLVLWFLYLSIANVGQTFYAFGWESMLLEAGFFAAFLGPHWMRAPLIPVLILRWMLFRTELGAGLIKLRHDPCWRELTCLYYHYETQPLPNPLSRTFHRFPQRMQRWSVLFSHFIQIVVPFGLFAPQPVAAICGGLAILHQLLLIVSGNYSWLNWLTVILGFSAFSDATLGFGAPVTHAVPLAMLIVLIALAAFTAIASVGPVRNFFSAHQAMNRSYNPFHLVGSYGAFGSVTRVRYEVVLEATMAPVLDAAAEWREYEFKAKPGDPMRRPPQIAPWHLRLDWAMWFLPFSVRLGRTGLTIPGHEIWFLRLVKRLLAADAPAIHLLRHIPFGEQRPTYIRALYYRYRFTTPEEKRATGAWWVRELIGTYLPPVSLAHLAAFDELT